jgi:hypothetical protein
VKPIAGCDRFRRLLLQHRNNPVHQGQLLLLPLRFRQRRQGGFAQLAEVAGQALGGFGGVEGLKLVQGVRRAGEGLMDR